MDDQTLAEMEMRLEDATPGPWRVQSMIEDPHEVAIDAPAGDARLGMGSWNQLAVAYGCEDEPYVGAWVAKRNATFIATARSDMKQLLDEVRRLQRELAAVTREEAARIRTARLAGAEAMRYAAVQALSTSWDKGACKIIGTMKVPFLD